MAPILLSQLIDIAHNFYSALPSETRWKLQPIAEPVDIRASGQAPLQTGQKGA
ncbi:hypothetical protein FBZ92_11765 [Nitrospirillum viridazoti]|uniref:Uncharacterized protein n=1 Tax=Nitrospirillum amazonense TaxID=28077 RepID=A0A560I4C2_9PROT|nr:hypothetical protein FBZ92_11765 [Nitrospirillum amazonense]